ncbi:MAG: BON domain-containing protein [Gemmatimonadales bacterium]|nr:BON domain-containing protein [Gemmatimonadota bacterium]MBK7783602.1 BON domain-containing protein [Gemmatimonadota bacterium]MBP6670307.1 BON domain-containing protein [Gemmatimonadales bacterium]MBP9198732.1 BON domain-containing protein [Gemmatimonadales bacterium]
MRHRSSASELLAWMLVGTAVGVAAGFALGEWLGPVGRRPAARAVPEGADLEAEPLPRPGAAETTRRAQTALAQEPALRELELTPIAVSPGVVELHGWVPSRGLRARAARAVAAAPGIDTLVNCLLVHGEDDTLPDTPDVADLPA